MISMNLGEVQGSISSASCPHVCQVLPGTGEISAESIEILVRSQVLFIVTIFKRNIIKIIFGTKIGHLQSFRSTKN